MTRSLTNFYQILNISPPVTDKEVREAYLRLALRYHPDRNNSQASRQIFAQINRAYTILKTKPQRAAYDRCLNLTPNTYPAQSYSKENERSPETKSKARAFAAALLEIFCPITLKQEADHG